MKTTVTKPIEIEIASVEMTLPVRYDEEEIPNDFPLRKGNVLQLTVDVDSGQIAGWPIGEPRQMFLTVKDMGTYELFDSGGQSIAKIEQNYVPHGLVPGKYGDVVRLAIDGQGVITNWPRKPDVSEFFDED